MKNFYRYTVAIVLTVTFLLPINYLFGGNPDRSGQAGASELLINPWIGSSGWGGANIAASRGLESVYTNVAGTAFTTGTELIFASTNYLKGADISIMNFGISQHVGEAGALSIAIMSMNFGDISRTTINNPDPSDVNIGTFAPNLMNISIAYAKAFSNSIYGGFNLKIVSESMADLSAQGIAIDAGIQYVTGPMENIKFGIALKNVGPTMKFSGDGLTFRGFYNQFSRTSPNFQQLSSEFELPAQLSIGGAYDFLFNENRFTVAGAFISNSFTKDQYILGGEFALSNYLMLRAGYTYEDGITEKSSRTTVYTGPSAGISIQIPLNKEKGSVFSVDYSYRDTDPFSGIHSIGARIKL
ncbi:MAG TPA: PorV/PorQ family protein [Bacteroidales bacterium]|nr:PorV/PorQ family protein [Bacteroidales bacterium]HPR57872.1 PorV/PorQ family protein [Bacteroidales bacterium]HRW96892.1 PorV/PorQ family protein [Bacteroidales bacterium]